MPRKLETLIIHNVDLIKLKAQRELLEGLLTHLSDELNDEEYATLTGILHMLDVWADERAQITRAQLDRLESVI